MRLVILLTAGLLLLSQTASVLTTALAGTPGRRERAARAALVLAVLAPVVVCLLLVLGVHLSRSAPFAPVDHAAVARQAALTGAGCGALCQLGSLRLFAGLALLALAGLGIVAVAVMALKAERHGAARTGPLALGLGASLVAAVLGGAALWLEQAMATVRQDWATTGADAARRLADALLRAEIPVLFVGAVVAAVAVAFVLYLLAARRRAAAAGADRLLAACAVVLLAIGVAAFAFTRRHADDVEHGIPHLIGRQDAAGRYRVPAAIDSATFGRLRAGPADQRLRLARKVQLPVSTAGTQYRPAIQVALSPSELVVEGRRIAALEAGRFAPGGSDREEGRIPELYSLLGKYSEIAHREGGRDDLDDVISLQADERSPFETVDRVIRTAAQAGFGHFRLVVLKEQQSPLSRARVAVINVSAPDACLGDAARADPYRPAQQRAGRPGHGRPGPTAADAGPAPPGPGDPSPPRLRKVEPADPNSDRPGAVRLLVEVGADGLALSAVDATGGAAVPDLEAKFPTGGAGHDFDGLTAALAKVRARYPASETVVVAAAADVAYGDVVRVLDATRERILDPRTDRRQMLFPRACLMLAAPRETSPE